MVVSGYRGEEGEGGLEKVSRVGDVLGPLSQALQSCIPTLFPRLEQVRIQEFCKGVRTSAALELFPRIPSWSLFCTPLKVLATLLYPTLHPLRTFFK